MVDSPCIDICTINSKSELCEGCGRSKEEIANWLSYSDEKKKTVLNHLKTRNNIDSKQDYVINNTLMNNLLLTFKKFSFPIILILILTTARLIPHPHNFTPILAVGIFAGFYFKNFFLSSFVVILSMFLGDIYFGFHNTMLFTYVALMIAAGLGLLIKKFKITEILFSGLSSSVCFFVITNFGVWLVSGIYEKNLVGLFESYVMAIPFFHNTLISTLIYLFVLKFLFNFSVKKQLA